MKATRLFLAICFFTISLSSNAQKLEKGTWLTGGTLSYINQNIKSVNNSNYSSTQGIFIGIVNVANMISSNLALGANITYLTTTASSTSAAVLGPSARIYFTNQKPSKVFFLGDVGFNTRGGDARYNLGLGLANFVSDNVSIDITGTYGNSFSSPFSTNNVLNSDFSYSVIALQVGLQVYLPKRKK